MKPVQGHLRSQRRQRQIAGNVEYKYRGWPCNIRPHAEVWYIGGQDTVGGGGGILEWCDSELDAEARLALMQKFPQFKGLRIGSNFQDDIFYASERIGKVDVESLSRSEYLLLLGQCRLVIRNFRWLQKTPEDIENADECILGWRSLMRTLKMIYHGPKNTMKEKKK